MNGKQHGRGIYTKRYSVKEGIWNNGIRIKWVEGGNYDSEEFNQG